MGDLNWNNRRNNWPREEIQISTREAMVIIAVFAIAFLTTCVIVLMFIQYEKTTANHHKREPVHLTNDHPTTDIPMQEKPLTHKHESSTTEQIQDYPLLKIPIPK